MTDLNGELTIRDAKRLLLTLRRVRQVISGRAAEIVVVSDVAGWPGIDLSLGAVLDLILEDYVHFDDTALQEE